MSDRKLGYIIISAFLILVLSIAGTVIWHIFLPQHTRIIEFSEVGSLEIQDPVHVKGVYAGQVKDIYLQGQKTHVKIKMHKPVVLHQGYIISLSSKGVMGDRYISIYPGPENAPIIDTNTILSGNFELGPSEALAFVDDLYEYVLTLRKITTDLYLGTPEQASLVSLFETLTLTIDSISMKLLHATAVIDNDLSKHIASLGSFIEKAWAITFTATEKFPEIATATEDLTQKAENLISEVEKVVVMSDSLIEAFGDSTLFIWNSDLDSLRDSFRSIRELIKEIREEGLILPVAPAFQRRETS
ncbi:hypothetical protein CHISP_3523 [Chitinispirillum alkaliphilum]|nr:hypothetical protein CHISP_3523 [Chitinispirillum alkaliphilum]